MARVTTGFLFPGSRIKMGKFWRIVTNVDHYDNKCDYICRKSKLKPGLYIHIKSFKETDIKSKCLN